MIIFDLLYCIPSGGKSDPVLHTQIEVENVGEVKNKMIDTLYALNPAAYPIRMDQRQTF